MATIDGSFGGGLTVTNTSQRIAIHDGSYTSPQPPPKTYYKMRGQDVDCGPLTYRTWVVSGVPDYTGAQYTGTRCGATPFSNVTIAATWMA